MGFWLLALLTFNFSFLTVQCGLDIEDSTPPSPPQWVPKSLPEEWPERGIDGHETGGIYVEWFSNPAEDNVQSYLLYRAEQFEVQDSLGDFILLATYESSAAATLDYIDRTAGAGIRYFYTLLSVDASENKSSPSDSISYLRLASVNSTQMQPNGLTMLLSMGRELQWLYSYNVAMENYIVTIVDVAENMLLRHEISPGNYVGSREHFIIPDTVVFLPWAIYKWRVDIGAQYVNGAETAGSESAWASFLYSP